MLSDLKCNTTTGMCTYTADKSGACGDLAPWMDPVSLVVAGKALVIAPEGVLQETCSGGSLGKKMYCTCTLGINGLAANNTVVLGQQFISSFYTDLQQVVGVNITATTNYVEFYKANQSDWLTWIEDSDAVTPESSQSNALNNTGNVITGPLYVGFPSQQLNVVYSTVLSETWICNSTDCPNGFNPGKSHTIYAVSSNKDATQYYDDIVNTDDATLLRLQFQ